MILKPALVELKVSKNNFSGNTTNQTATIWSFLEKSKKRQGTKLRQLAVVQITKNGSIPKMVLLNKTSDRLVLFASLSESRTE